ncbi:MAG: hypothetical protein ACI4A3_13275 [Lachnospiraceae bacterium]
MSLSRSVSSLFSRLIAKNLLNLGLLSISMIAQNTGLSVTEVEALAKE